jgi:hypothetical protein
LGWRNRSTITGVRQRKEKANRKFEGSPTKRILWEPHIPFKFEYESSVTLGGPEKRRDEEPLDAVARSRSVSPNGNVMVNGRVGTKRTVNVGIAVCAKSEARESIDVSPSKPLSIGGESDKTADSITAERCKDDGRENKYVSSRTYDAGRSDANSAWLICTVLESRKRNESVE